MVTLILFVLIFGVVVISHEFGTFSAGESQRDSCDRIFCGHGSESVFLPKGDTKYSLKLLPIGGACMFEGEDGLNEKKTGKITADRF